MKCRSQVLEALRVQTLKQHENVTMALVHSSSSHLLAGAVGLDRSYGPLAQFK
jgi:hypothetical protein